MALPEDVIVTRDPSSKTQLPYVVGEQKIGVVGRSRGKNVLADIEITRGSGATDSLPSSMKTPLRRILNVHYNDEIYYPNVHFLVTDRETPPNILNPENLGEYESPSDILIDWSVAPPLTPPSIANVSLLSASEGFSSATTVYYAITVVDHSDNESNVGSITKVEIPAPTSGSYQVVLTWRLVEYCKGYNVYRGNLPDGSDLEKINSTLLPKSTISFTDANNMGTISPPSQNTTRAKPKSNTSYLLKYYYAMIVTNTPVEYTDVLQVIEDHGVGSELSNVARIFMDRSYNNAPILVTVVPEGTSYNSYLDALRQFETYPVDHIVVLYAGSDDLDDYITNFQAIYNFAASLSDENMSQKECYVWTSIPYSNDLSVNSVRTFCNAFQNTATKGKRGHCVIPDGFKVEILNWINPDGSVTSNYTLLDPEGVDITPIVFAGACASRYCGLRDCAEPLTEKDIIGFRFAGRKFTTSEVRMLRSYGAMVVENISGIAVVSQSINMSLPVLGTEDGELSIACTEDWMKKDLRNALRPLRGQKMLSSVFDHVKSIITDKLRQYVDNMKIAYFNPRSVSAYQNPNDKTQILASFEYMPIYPCNKVRVMYKMIFVAL